MRPRECASSAKNNNYYIFSLRELYVECGLDAALAGSALCLAGHEDGMHYTFIVFTLGRHLSATRKTIYINGSESARCSAHVACQFGAFFAGMVLPRSDSFERSCRARAHRSAREEWA